MQIWAQSYIYLGVITNLSTNNNSCTFALRSAPRSIHLLVMGQFIPSMFGIMYHTLALSTFHCMIVKFSVCSFIITIFMFYTTVDSDHWFLYWFCRLRPFNEAYSGPVHDNAHITFCDHA